MSHPYLSTQEIADLVKQQSARPAQPGDLGDDELVAIKAEARRVGALLVAIPFWSMVVFSIRVFFALTLAGLLYTLLWWIIDLVLLGGGATFMHGLSMLVAH